MAQQQSKGHGKAQTLLLVSKILDNRDQSSPFTLVVDSLEQPARPLIREYLTRAKLFKTSVLYVSFASLRAPEGVQHFIRAYDVSPSTLQQRVASIISSEPRTRHVIIVDALNQLCEVPTINVAHYLSSFISLTTSLVAVYHSDQPLSPAGFVRSPHQPHPLTVLRFLATSIIQVVSFAHCVAAKAARDRSVSAPSFGLHEDREGVLQGIRTSSANKVVLEIEHRRKSGRSVAAQVVLLLGLRGGSHDGRGKLVLLEDHPVFKPPEIEVPSAEDELGEVSFSLGLTEKQRRDRDAVVLPYFDAQNEAGAPGEGGRILYEMGAEDDFDEEEDEI